MHLLWGIAHCRFYTTVLCHRWYTQIYNRNKTPQTSADISLGGWGVSPKKSNFHFWNLLHGYYHAAAQKEEVRRLNAAQKQDVLKQIKLFWEPNIEDGTEFSKVTTYLQASGSERETLHLECAQQSETMWKMRCTYTSRRCSRSQSQRRVPIMGYTI